MPHWNEMQARESKWKAQNEPIRSAMRSGCKNYGVRQLALLLTRIIFD
jgi:hypothetical protein